jgi:hypothetical protein
MFLLLVSLVSVHFPFDVDTPFNENSLHPLAWRFCCWLAAPQTASEIF